MLVTLGTAGQWKRFRGLRQWSACEFEIRSAEPIAVGLDGEARTTNLHFDPRPTLLAVNSGSYHFALEPQQLTSVFVAVTCNYAAEHRPAPFIHGLLAHRREMRRSTAGAASGPSLPLLR